MVQESVDENETHVVEKRRTSNLLVYKGANSKGVLDVTSKNFLRFEADFPLSPNPRPCQCHEGNN